MKLVCLVFFGWTFTLLGQQPAPQPSAAPLPAGPLLKRAPKYSTWKVISQGLPVTGEAPSPKAATTGTGGQEKDVVVMQSSVVKTGSTIFEEDTDANGHRRQVWHASGLRIVMEPGSSNPVVCPDFGGGDIYSVNYAEADFAGLDWISAKTYTGMSQYQGRDCIVFQSSVSPLDGLAQKLEAASIRQARALGHHVADAIIVSAVVYIDLETRLPLYAEFGKQKRTYQYGAPLTAPLVLPTQVSDPAKAYEQRLQRLSAPASRPY